MADVASLGVHTPVALPYLIAEGILPRQPTSDLYRWRVYVSDQDDRTVEEEVLTTSRCVVWSQGRSVRTVYRFDLDGEAIVEALLTNFQVSKLSSEPDKRGPVDASGRQQSGGSPTETQSKGLFHRSHRVDTSNRSQATNRSLVVFLKTKAHIYFINGSSHVVDLPFEVGAAFSAPRGIFVQAKVSPSTLSPETQLPLAPPNSFHSRMRMSSSYLESPTLRKHAQRTEAGASSLLGASARPPTTLQLGFGASKGSDEDSGGVLYTLTDPLSDFGIVSHYHVQQKLGQHRSAKTPHDVVFHDLGADESIVYVSSDDGLGHDHCRDCTQLVLLVTYNREVQTLSVWHAWYVDQKPLLALVKQRTAQKAVKARRRSSFMTASFGPGTATPSVRHREGARESFAATGLAHPSRDHTSRQAAPSARKPTRQEEEEAMASQMDPDHQNVPILQTSRDTRRVSSLHADLRTSQHAPVSGVLGTSVRRNASFGGVHERRSFGRYRAMASIFGAHNRFAAEVDSMNIDEISSAHEDDVVETVIQHVRATADAAGSHGVLSNIDDSPRRDVVVRRVHAFNLQDVQSSPTTTTTEADSFRVLTLSEHHPARETEDQRLNLYLHNHVTKALLCLQLLIKTRTLWPEALTSPEVAVPFVIGEIHMGQVTDICKIRHDGIEAILVAEQGILLSLDHRDPCPVTVQAPYRVHETVGMPVLGLSTEEQVGKNRTVTGPYPSLLSLDCAGARGAYDEVGRDGIHHRRSLRLRPKNELFSDALSVCRMMLSAPHSSMVTCYWQLACGLLRQHPGRLYGTTQTVESVAFASTIFFCVADTLDDKARAALHLMSVAATSRSQNDAVRRNLHSLQHDARLSRQSSAWEWIPSEAQALSASKARKDQMITIAASVAIDLRQSHPWISSCLQGARPVSSSVASKIMLGLHVLREESKLCTLTANGNDQVVLAAVVAQVGSWLGLRAWSYDAPHYYHLEGANADTWTFVKSEAQQPDIMLMDEPVSIFQWFEHAITTCSTERYPSVVNIASLGQQTRPTPSYETYGKRFTKRTASLSDMLEATASFTAAPRVIVEHMTSHAMTRDVLSSLPEAIAAPMRDAISCCEAEPPTTWHRHLLDLVGRSELELNGPQRIHSRLRRNANALSRARDAEQLCHAVDHHQLITKTKEASRHAISQLVFSEDRRLVHATSLMHFNGPQFAECPKQPDWTDAHHLEQQRKVLQFVTLRMTALPIGDGMVHYESQTPLLTERYHLPGFSNACTMQPMGHTLTVDRSGLTEEKVSWAYFHAGVSAGLRIARSARGIDTSWVAFNKPNELSNRHAGLLLALGLTGHLQNLAKWLSFKYLTPKHTVTSIGLLLGLSASYMGTMDGLITRMLSVHIKRMLPPGAAELNVSPITQTAGLIGIGLLYYNTQHRRMSEIMLSEIESMELEDPDSGPDPLRNESYRLAAGFALGYINLAKGRDLHGLYGMSLPERLLSVAIGPRPVNAVHVFDRATAGAIVAIALIYMKSGDQAVARKIDIPDAEAQFDHVRPDMLMLRAMVKQIILWDDIRAREPDAVVPKFVQDNLPECYRDRFQQIKAGLGKHPLKSSDVPFLNIVSGLIWALSLRYAGSGNTNARDEALKVLDYMYMIRSGADAYYYDAKLARSTVRRCIDVVALAAATVMSGTGDLKTFRYLRRLHGRTDADTTYGSHLAAHLAIGVLFLGGGIYSFRTTPLAIASLIAAFYPLFPTDVQDNHVHLQALRHFWVFAAEARCLTIEDIDSQRPISMSVLLTMKDGSTRKLTAPCLLPGLDDIRTVRTTDVKYWQVTLDFAGNAEHLRGFRRSQRIFVRRCPAGEAEMSRFASSLIALNPSQPSLHNPRIQLAWHSIFDVLSLKDINKAEVELIIAPDDFTSMQSGEHSTMVDDKLVLNNAVRTGDRNALWNLRLLFAWAERAQQDGDEMVKWIGNEAIHAIWAKIDRRQGALQVAM